MLGEHVGLLHSFVAVLALVIVAGLIAPAARPLAATSEAEPEPVRVPVPH
jgi:hypothetical protein